MNRTFKVVFNRARACLVVANEITRAIQKKGAKSVLVATVLASGLILFPASYAHAEKSGGQIDTPASGDYGNTDTLTGKAVSITEGETITGNVYGAYTTTNSTEVSDNSVTVSESTVKSSGGRTSIGGISGGGALVLESENPTATANANKVTVSNGSTFEGLDISAGIFGGLVYTYTETEGGNATATTNTNSVSVSGGSTVKGELYSQGIIGGYALSYTGVSGDATATANGNSVSVSNSKVEVDIAGGHAYAYTDSGSAIATANNNSVSVRDKSEVFGNIYGGYAELFAPILTTRTRLLAIPLILLALTASTEHRFTVDTMYRVLLLVLTTTSLREIH